MLVRLFVVYAKLYNNIIGQGTTQWDSICNHVVGKHIMILIITIYKRTYCDHRATHKTCTDVHVYAAMYANIYFYVYAYVHLLNRERTQH